MKIEDVVFGKQYFKRGGDNTYIQNDSNVVALRINDDKSGVYVQDLSLDKRCDGKWCVCPEELHEITEDYPEIPIDDKPKTNISVSTAAGLTILPIPDNDMVNHPNHYTSGNIECIDAIKEAINGLVGIEAFCTANAIKYLWRWKRKNGTEDLEKAKWYIDRLIKELKE